MEKIIKYSKFINLFFVIFGMILIIAGVQNIRENQKIGSDIDSKKQQIKKAEEFLAKNKNQPNLLPIRESMESLTKQVMGINNFHEVSISMKKTKQNPLPDNIIPGRMLMSYKMIMKQNVTAGIAKVKQETKVNIMPLAMVLEELIYSNNIRIDSVVVSLNNTLEVDLTLIGGGK